MAEFFRIPLAPQPQRIAVNMAGNTYNLRFAYSDAPDGGWYMDIFDAGGNPLICGLMLTAGLDLLQPYPDLRIGVQMYLVAANESVGPLTYSNLGTDWQLIFTAG